MVNLLLKLAIMFYISKICSPSSGEGSGQSSGQASGQGSEQGFFHFGTEQNDLLARRGDDVSTRSSTIVPIVIFQNAETDFYISSNGLLSFRSSYTSFTPQLFTSNFFEFSGPIIAPLWADFFSGIVNSGSIFYRSTQDSPVLCRVQEMITDISSNYSDYQPTQAVIVTWDSVRPLHQSFEYSYTFQAVISTDGKRSFAIFIYQHDDLFMLNELERYQIGFNAGDKVRMANIEADSLDVINIFQIDGKCITRLRFTGPEDLCPWPSSANYSNPQLLLPYGDCENDSRVPPQLDATSGPNHLNTSIIFFQNKENTFYVSSNGLVSFRESFSSFSPRPFTRDFSEAIIAPLWVDYFGSEASGNVFFRSTQSEETLYRIQEIIADEDVTSSYSDYQPTVAVIVTWSSVVPFTYSTIYEILAIHGVPNGFVVPSKDSYTFQVVIATDGEITFAILLYQQTDFSSLDHSSRRRYQIGFNGGGGIGRSNIDPDTIEAVNIFELMYAVSGLCITRLGSKDLCPLKSYATRCDEDEMIPLSCNCDFGVKSPLCLFFFPFGPTFSDIVFERAINQVVNVSVDVSFRFYRQLKHTLYVSYHCQTTQAGKHNAAIQISSNGLISFVDEFKEFRVTPFPRVSGCSVPLIAPLWADYNFRLGGNVYYRVTNDGATLNLARKVISQEKFSPTLCVVVTWSDATLLKHPSRPKLTFQAVLATDNDSSYAIFSYEKLEAIRSIPVRDKIIGFDAGDQTRSGTVLYDAVELPSFGLMNIFRIDGHCVTTAEDSCKLGLIPMKCGANFSAEACLCGINSSSTDTCKLSHFFPFGTESDIIGPKEVDASEEIMDITKKFIFYNREHTKLYVSTNGFVTFDGGYKTNSLSQTLRDASYPMIAPLWADYNFRERGIIYYRVAKDTDTLRAIDDRIAKTSSGSDYTAFRPTEAVIVTWFQSRVFERENEDGTNFQAVIVTDENITFAIFLYDGKNFNGTVDPIVGFSAADDHKRTHTSNSEVLERYFRIDGECVIELQDDICGLKSTPFECDPQFPIVCQCNGGHRPVDGSCIEFFNFGPRAEDSTFMTSYNRQSIGKALNISIPIIFYGKKHFVISIHAEGVISLGHHESIHLTHFNLNNAPFPVIAPISALRRILEVNPNITMGNIVNIPTSLHYRVVTPVNDSSGVLREIDSVIARENDATFNSTLAIIATWQLSVGDFLVQEQTTVATDGKASFVIINYQLPGGIPSFNLPEGLMGFSPGLPRASKNTASITTIEYHQVFRVDGTCITSATSGSMCDLNSAARKCEAFNATGCLCNSGYRQTNDPLTCSNINECDNMTLCEQSCINTDGSYYCECWEGYTLNSDKTTCEDTNECEDETLCDQNCLNTNGSYYCECWDGYTLNNDNKTCEDINECENETQCDQRCVNYNGSYYCECWKGTLSSDNSTCEESLKSTAFTISSTTIPSMEFGITTISMGVILGVISLLTLILITILAVFLSYRRRNERKLPLANLGREIQRGKSYSLNHYKVRSSSGMKFPSSHILPSCNLKLADTLGQGEFGVVYKGYVKKAGLSMTFNDTVAVKTLKGFVQKELVEDLLKECNRMLSFDHPNVLKLVGVCLDGGPAPYIIMPFMANGSISAYLRKERENLFLDPDITHPDASAVEKRLLDMCLQIAKGMEYLASKRVIHRDLAARNCMIDVNLLIKVADFGLAECLDSSKEYFRQDMDSAIKFPVKWMAPESIHDSVFSEKSDVWSYGVTCWEVFSAGKTPYPGIHPTDLPQQLDKGLRLEKPLNAACTDEIYSLILKCWDSEAHLRPNFSELVNLFMSDLVTKADYMDFSPPSLVRIGSEGVENLYEKL